MSDLGSIARGLQDVEQGIACAGTALESRTYTTKKKAFLFVSKQQARLKLDASADEARALGFAPGANGWVTLPLDGLPAAAVLRRWVAESQACVAAAKPVKRAAPAARKKA